MKVLIVDDDAELSEMIVTILTIKEINARAVNDSKKAISAMKEFKPDAVLLDIMMPDIDGFEICRRIRADEELKKTAIVMYTCKNYAGNWEAARDSGADGFLNKTTPPEMIIEVLKEQVARKLA